MADSEETEAHAAMRKAESKDELVAVWWSLCDHAKGAQRERLQDTYGECLKDFTPMMRAG